MIRPAIILEGARVRARLIREGRSKNGNVWTRDVLEQIAKLANGVPVHFYDFSKNGDGSFLDHYGAIRDRLPPMIRAFLPERLPEATVGTIANASVVVENDGRASVVGDVEIPESAGWFRSLLERFRAFGREVGLSIHVPEDGIEAKPVPGGGVEPVKVSRVVGFDCVSYPSAGGGFVPVLESLSLLVEERKLKNLAKRLLRAVPKDKRGAIKTPEGVIESAREMVEKHEEFSKAVLESLGIKFDAATAAAVLEAIASVEIPEEPVADPKSQDGQPSGVVLESAETKELRERLARVEAAQRASLVEGVLAGAQLDAEATNLARTILESKADLSAESAKEIIATVKKAVGAKKTTGSVLEGAGNPAISLGISSGEKAVAAMQALLEGRAFGVVETADGKKEKVPAFRGIREAYGVLTGDVHVRGREFFESRRRPVLEGVDLESVPTVRNFLAMGGSLTEALSTASFPLILSDAMHKMMAKEYAEQPLLWKLVARKENVSDFKDYHVHRLGEFGDLASVNEGAAYQDFAGAAEPSEDADVTVKATKKGNKVSITWEMIVNDDLGAIRRIPMKLARAANRSLNKAVFNHLLTNATIYDSSALAHAANHANLVTTAAPDLTTLRTMRNLMIRQKDIDARESGRVRPVGVVCGPEQFGRLYDLIYSPNKPVLGGTATNPALGTAETSTIENPNIPNILRGEWGLVLNEVNLFDDVDTDQYWMLGDPNAVDMIVVAFLNGQEEPALFVQDLPKVGSFFDSERLTYKVRHIWGTTVADYRGFVGGIPA